MGKCEQEDKITPVLDVWSLSPFLFGIDNTRKVSSKKTLYLAYLSSPGIFMFRYLNISTFFFQNGGMVELWMQLNPFHFQLVEEAPLSTKQFLKSLMNNSVQVRDIEKKLLSRLKDGERKIIHIFFYRQLDFRSEPGWELLTVAIFENGLETELTLPAKKHINDSF